MTVIEFPTPPGAAPAPGPQPGGYAPAPVGTPAGTAYTLVDGIAQSGHPEPARHQQHGDVPPVIATWLRTSEGRRSAARETIARTRYRTTFHGLRIPVYLARLIRRSPWGFGRILRMAWALIVDREGTESIRALRVGGASGNLQAMEDTHRSAVKFRVIATLVMLVIAPFVWLVVGVAIGAASPAVGFAIILGGPIVLLLALGWIGRHPDRKIIERVIFAGSEVPKLTQDLILHALASARIPGFDKAFKVDGPKCIRWQQPPTRTKNGFEAILDLPAGVTVEAVAKVSSNVASGLGRSSSTVWINTLPEEQGGYDGRLHLVVTHKPMRMTPMPSWPLANPESGPVDLFSPVPFGLDYTGESVDVTLMFRAVVVGAIPRMGKSFTVREMLTAAALCPECELHIYDLKGGADFLDFAMGDTAVAHAFRSGSSAEDSKAMLADLRAMKRDMEARYTMVRKLTVEQPERIPNGKITRDLAADKALGLHPVVLAIDETQVCFVDWPDRKEFGAIIADLAKRGPAVGIIVILATQSIDSKTIPTSISRMAGLRFALKVTDHIASEQILGTGTHAKGYQPDNLRLEDTGIGYLAGEGSATKLVRTYLITKDQGAQGDQLIPILQRARAQRIAADRLTGIAAGEVEDLDDDLGGVVDHVLEVWPLGNPAVHADVLAGLLAERWPTMYGGWGPNELASALGPTGIRSKQKNLMTATEGRKNRQGYELAQFGEYLDQRDGDLDEDLEDED